MAYYFLLLSSVISFTPDVYVSANPPKSFKETFKQHVEEISKDNKVCRGLAMLHLFGTPITNPFKFSNEEITEWKNAGNAGKVSYEKAVIDNFEKIAIDGWTNSEIFRSNYATRGHLENSQMSLHSAYSLFINLTGGDAEKSTKRTEVKINSEDEKELKSMVLSFPILNFDVNMRLDTDVTRTIRNRYFYECFDFVFEKMKKRFPSSHAEWLARQIHGLAENLDQYQKRGTAGTTETHSNNTGYDTSASGHGPSKRQKMYDTPGIDETLLSVASDFRSHVDTTPLDMTFDHTSGNSD